MIVQILSTQQCCYSPNLARELQDLGVDYEVVYAEENPELFERLNIRHSPSLVVDERVICRGQPTEGELRTLLGL